MSVLPKCETCLQFLEFHTDWIGQVIWKHPDRKCIPAPAPVYQEEIDESVLPQQTCEECGGPFYRGRNKGGQTLCSSDCRIVRKTRKLKESYQRRGKWWKTAA